MDMPAYPALSEDLRVDVCIVGGGISGLTTAYMLVQSGRSVAVIDDGQLGGGMTAFTTAHLTCVLDERYHEIERLRGEENARLAAESHLTAINRIETIIGTEAIACDFERLNGYLCLAPGDDVEILEREVAAAQRAGIDASIVHRPPHPSPEPGPCLLFPNQAQFHPLKYLAGLARAIERDGGRLFTMTHAEHLEGGSPARVMAAGHVVTADVIVVATNTPVNNLVTVHGKQSAWMTYAAGFRVPPGALPRALFWDTGRPYHYVRVHASSLGNGSGEILIVGGEDHRTGQEEDTNERQARLEAWARQRFPVIGEPEYTWAGQVMQTAEGLAYIGRNPGDHDSVYIVTGDSGTGLTHGTIAGILITDLVEGRDNPWEGLYDPSRKLLKAVGGYAAEAARNTSMYVDYITPGDVRTVEEIPMDSGAVVNEGLSRVAIYRDESGAIHRRSAVCTHLGCIVRWNRAERTWDCPCHGSRYDRFGVVINGPANRDLDPR